MSEADRRRDPRAEDEDTGDHAVEKPFDKKVPSVNTPIAMVVDASTSEVRPVAPPRSSETASTRARAAEPSVPDLIDFERPDRARPTPSPASEEPSWEDSRQPLTGSHSIPETVEQLINDGRWKTIVELLGPAERVHELPPHIALVYAIACAETNPDDASVAELVIKTTARAHGIAETSPMTRVIAKRIVRRMPVAWGKRPAPRGTISMIIVFVALVLGGGGGFWLSTTNVKLPLPSFLQSK